MKDKLIELIDTATSRYIDLVNERHEVGQTVAKTCAECEAEYLLANGVFILPEDLRGSEDFSISAFIEAMQMYKEKDRYIKPPCKVGDYVRFKGLTSLWQVDAIHYYREGLPQISVTNGKITTTVTDDGMFEVFTKEEAEEKLRGLGK